MNTVNFTGALKLVAVKTNNKVSNVIEAGIDLTPTINKFSLNRLAVKLMGLEVGDTVRMFVNSAAANKDEKFFICKGAAIEEGLSATDGLSAKLGGDPEQGLDFNFADIYSNILLTVVNDDVKVEGVAKERLRQLGLAKNDTSLVKVYAKLRAAFEQEIDGETVTVYNLFDFMTSDHTPKVFKAKV